MTKILSSLIVALTFSACGHVAVKPSLPEPIPTPTATATPVPVPTPTPSPSAKPLALIVWGANAAPSLKVGGSDYEYGQKTLKAVNDAFASGCIHERLLTWDDLISLNGVVLPKLNPKQREEAYQRYVAGAPYALDARWYYTLSRVIGYTYNYKDGYESGPSETYVWTNTRMGLGFKDYASHLSHELSHQSRAGGFVHYTYHEGSYPYEIGDIVSDCIYYPAKAQAFTFMKSLGSPKTKKAISKLKMLESQGYFH